MTLQQLDLPVAPSELDPIPARLNMTAGRPAAVLVGLTLRDTGWHVIMTERAAHLAHHAGQISFPGGKVEEDDLSLTATALREAEEEIALAAERVDVIGGLAQVTSPVGFVVQPVVGIIAAGTALAACPNEVAKILVLPLEELVSRNRHRRESYLREGQRRNVWVIDHEDHYIWGLSAAILVDLATRIGKLPAEQTSAVGIAEPGI